MKTITDKTVALLRVQQMSLLFYSHETRFLMY